jgi:hypothetical protein
MDLSFGMWLALVSGIAIAAACGLRAFLPLLALGIAGRFGVLELKSGSEWLTSDLALICFGFATVVEIAGDKIPVVDHALDFVGTLIRPAAAWLGAYSVLVHWPTPWAQIAAGALGGGALAVHAIKAKLRLGSSVVSLGQGNPWLSATEDIVASAILLTALLAPLIALLLVVLLVWTLSRRRKRASVQA